MGREGRKQHNDNSKIGFGLKKRGNGVVQKCRNVIKKKGKVEFEEC